MAGERVLAALMLGTLWPLLEDLLAAARGPTGRCPGDEDFPWLWIRSILSRIRILLKLPIVFRIRVRLDPFHFGQQDPDLIDVFKEKGSKIIIKY